MQGQDAYYDPEALVDGASSLIDEDDGRDRHRVDGRPRSVLLTLIVERPGKA